MRGKNIKKFEELPAPIREHCPDCCFYLDGKKTEWEDFENGMHVHGLMIFPVPGMQHRRMSKGTIYQRIGTATPCHCATGTLVNEGYKKNADGSKQHSVNGNVKVFFMDPVLMKKDVKKEPVKTSEPEPMIDIVRRMYGD